MKLQFKHLSFLLLFICCFQFTNAQLFKSLKSKAKEKVVTKANEKVDHAIDKGVNKVSEKVDTAVNSIGKGKDKNATAGPLKLVQQGKFVTTQIKFDEGSDQLTEESFTLLNDIAEIMKQNPEMKVKIICHTDSSDSDGEAEANLNLSIARATSIKTHMTTVLSIEETLLETEGLGGGFPISNSNSEEGKTKNRRVEFVKM